MGNIPKAYPELVAELKRVRKLKEMSYQDVLDSCEAAGEGISLSTVRRVFSEGSEQIKFRYNTSLGPISRAVLGLDDPAPVEMQPEEAVADNAALRMIVDIKNEQLATYRAELNLAREDAQKKIEYLKKETIDLKKALRLTRICLAVLAAVVLAAIILDAAIGSVGWFRW